MQMKGMEEASDDEERIIVAVKISLVVLVVRLHINDGTSNFQKRQLMASRIALESLECDSDV